jgi:hypothetical protein
MAERRPSRVIRFAHIAVTVCFWGSFVVVFFIAQAFLTVLEDSDPAASLLSLGSATLRFGLVILTLHLVRRMTRAALRGDPFNRANVRRLRWIALIATTEPIQRFAVFAAGNLLESAAQAANLAITASIEAVVLGLCLFALAEVFAYGVRLREDVEATV